MELCDIGVFGLGVMGENLALNFSSHGYRVAVYNRTVDKMVEFLQRNQGKDLCGFGTIEEFINALRRPRKILITVKAGSAVDDVIARLKGYLEPGDILMDGGNSHFRDTEARAKMLEQIGINYFGIGISGGELGALLGPSIMPGGNKEAYTSIEGLLNDIAAKVSDGPCCTYIGPYGAGHYVKMVHNGCEYAIMQLISEVYGLMKLVLGMDNASQAEVFASWDKGRLNSYLIEITAKILTHIDEDTGAYTLDYILDKGGQKGTGRWTGQEALELDIPIPSIDSALWARNLSVLKDLRVRLDQRLHGQDKKIMSFQLDTDTLEQALYCAVILAYSQGIYMLTRASEAYGFNLNISEIARIWKGGCIIRSKFLEHIQRAYKQNPNLEHLLLDDEISEMILETEEALRKVSNIILDLGLPAPGFPAAAGYLSMLSSSRMFVNLIQAQRDFFGAHGFERTDHPGFFHVNWE